MNSALWDVCLSFCFCLFLSCHSPKDGLSSLSSQLQMTVVDGASGSIIWSHSIPCHMKETPTTSAITSDQKSVFLFWAEALTTASLNSVSEDRMEGLGMGMGSSPSLWHRGSCCCPGLISYLLGLSGNRSALLSWASPLPFHQQCEHWAHTLTIGYDREGPRWENHSKIPCSKPQVTACSIWVGCARQGCPLELVPRSSGKHSWLRPVRCILPSLAVCQVMELRLWGPERNRM